MLLNFIHFYFNSLTNYSLIAFLKASGAYFLTTVPSKRALIPVEGLSSLRERGLTSHCSPSSSMSLETSGSSQEPDKVPNTVPSPSRTVRVHFKRAWQSQATIFLPFLILTEASPVSFSTQVTISTPPGKSNLKPPSTSFKRSSAHLATDFSSQKQLPVFHTLPVAPSTFFSTF